MTVRPSWRWVGDRALLRDFTRGGLAERNAAARVLHRRLGGTKLEEVEESIPGAASVLVVLRAGAAPSTRLLAVLDAPARERKAERVTRVHEIEVRYGGEAGPDLQEVASHHGLGERDVVELHTSASYVVGFLGFSPGFAYLIGLPRSLAMPRLATPRVRVPAGSVAIGGEFTAVYPRSTPGGWRIVGRAEVALFDPQADPPARLLPGDRVRFVAR